MQDLAEVSEVRTFQAFPGLLSVFYKVFFEHVLPQVASWGGLLKDRERRWLQAVGGALGETREEWEVCVSDKG